MSAKRKLSGKVTSSAAKRPATDDPDAESADKKPERCFWVYANRDSYWPALAAFGVCEYDRVRRIKDAAVDSRIERSKHHYEELNSSNIHVVLRESDAPVSFNTVVKSLVVAQNVSGQDDWIERWESAQEEKEREEEFRGSKKE